jgi:hypothetical protein
LKPEEIKMQRVKIFSESGRHDITPSAASEVEKAINDWLEEEGDVEITDREMQTKMMASEGYIALSITVWIWYTKKMPAGFLD